MKTPTWADMVGSFRYVRGVSRAVRRGGMFPASGRRPPVDAPGGSTFSPVRPFRLNERWDFQTTTHRVPIVGLGEPIRILHLSDVHLRGPEPWVDGLCARLADPARTPDLVALTGDVVTRGWTEAVAHQFLDAVPRARLGTWAVIGNWEVWGGAPKDVWRGLLAEHGIRLLVDENVDLGPLTLIGTDDLASGTPDVAAAFRDAAADKPALVLTHSPALFPELARGPARVVLAGHTHGGQVRLPGLGAFFLPRGSGDYPHGWYRQGETWLFVHRGVGWSVAPWRWRAPPELAWIDLEPA